MANYPNQNNGPRELEWDDEIQHDSTFTLLPEGDYNFGVMSFERGRHNGSDKLPPCNKAILQINLWNDAGDQTQITHNLFLHSSVEGILCAFFTAIGQRKHGDKLVMNWATVPGSCGRCHVGIRTYTKEGEEKQINQITRFLEPDESVTGIAQNTASFQAGKF